MLSKLHPSGLKLEFLLRQLQVLFQQLSSLFLKTPLKLGQLLALISPELGELLVSLPPYLRCLLELTLDVSDS